MWLPITTFFALGYEHSIVNMFIIPAGMMFGAPVSLIRWLVWTQVRVTLGNMFAGFAFTALLSFLNYHPKPSSRTAPALVERQEAAAAS